MVPLVSPLPLPPPSPAQGVWVPALAVVDQRLALHNARLRGPLRRLHRHHRNRLLRHGAGLSQPPPHLRPRRLHLPDGDQAVVRGRPAV